MDAESEPFVQYLLVQFSQFLRQVCQFLLVHVGQSIKSAKSLLFTSDPRASVDFLVLFFYHVFYLLHGGIRVCWG